MQSGMQEGPTTRVVEATGAMSRAREDPSPEPFPEQVARFWLGRRLGEGGMGVVFLARDPALARSLAVKLVRHPYSAEESRRLRREAQALAQLSHPNVVQVFEVGTVDGRVYIAMEYVPGEDLGRRLRRGSRDPRALREALLQVGRGLTAAHDQGLLHRDLKPSNVLLGDDGRARLVDFGLAQAKSPSSTPTTRRLASPDPTGLGCRELDERLTEDGIVVGTPSYMAPEQLRGALPTELSYQFGYCVMAAEGIRGRHPFDHPPPTAARVEALAGMQPADPVWARWWPHIRRGLSVEPSRRWPSMGALTEAMERAAGGRRRGGPIVRLGSLALGSLALGSVTLGLIDQARDRDERPCKLARQQASARWEARRETLDRAMSLASTPPRLRDSWSRLRPQLQGNTDAWLAAHQAACEDDPALLRPLLAPQAQCLEEHHQVLMAQLALLSTTDPSSAQGGLESLASFEPIHACLTHGPARDRHGPRDSPEDTALAELQALVNTDRLPQAESVAASIRLWATDSADPSLRLRAQYWLGKLDAKQGRLAEAEASLERAYFDAHTRRMDATAFEAAMELSRLVGNELHRLDDGLEWARHARARLQRMAGSPGHLHRTVRIDILEGGIRSAKGQHEQALAQLEGALASLEPLRAGHPLLEARARCVLGNARGRRGDGVGAERELHRCLELQRTVLGPTTPRQLSTLGNLGNALLMQERASDALPLFAEELRLSQEVHGEAHLETALAHLQYASALEADDQLAGAREAYRRGIARLESMPGPEHLWISLASNNLGTLVRRTGQHEQARSLFLRALDVRERTLGSEHPSVLTPLLNLISLDLERGRLDAARGYLERAVSLVEQTNAEVSPDDEATLRRYRRDLERAENPPRTHEPSRGLG